ncbi:MAG: hypothetical protein WAV48_02230 [Candidatus Magasanikiibacteriota bacterium]
MNTKQGGSRKMTVDAFIFRVMIVVTLEIILLYFGNVSLLVHFIIFGITTFTTSVLACVVFLSDAELEKIFEGIEVPKERKK